MESVKLLKHERDFFNVNGIKFLIPEVVDDHDRPGDMYYRGAMFIWLSLNNIEYRVSWIQLFWTSFPRNQHAYAFEAIKRYLND